MGDWFHIDIDGSQGTAQKVQGLDGSFYFRFQTAWDAQDLAETLDIKVYSCDGYDNAVLVSDVPVNRVRRMETA